MVALTTVYLKDLTMQRPKDYFDNYDSDDYENEYIVNEPAYWLTGVEKRSRRGNKLEDAKLQAGMTKYDYDTERLTIIIHGQMLDTNSCFYHPYKAINVTNNTIMQQKCFKAAAKNNTKADTLSFIIDKYAEDESYAKYNRQALASFIIGVYFRAYLDEY